MDPESIPPPGSGQRQATNAQVIPSPRPAMPPSSSSSTPSSRPGSALAQRRAHTSTASDIPNPAVSPSDQDDQTETITRFEDDLKSQDRMSCKSILENCRLNSNNFLEFNGSPKCRTGRKNDSVIRKAYRKTRAFLRSKYRKIFKPKEPNIANGPRNRFSKTVKVAIMVNNQEIMRFAQAKFDTGNPKNLMSPAFARQFSTAFKPRERELILDLPGNAQLYRIGTINARWRVQEHEDENECGGLRFDDKFVVDCFDVSECEERFDIVIGSDTIEREGLLQWRPDLGLTGYRTKPQTMDSQEVAVAEKQQDNTIEDNEARKKAREKAKSKTSNSAR